MRIHLIAFGSPYKEFADAHKRFFLNAKEFGCFDNILLFSEKNVYDFCKDLIPHKTFLSSTRGYGCWIWKSFLVSTLMQEIPDNDIICYVDIGSTFNKRAKARFHDYINQTIKYNAVCFEIPYKEYDWTKMDTYHRIFPDNLTHFYSNQRAGGIFFLKNNQITRNIISEIKKISTENKYKFISDAPSKLQNHNSFKEHRHDQSVFSLISKKYNFFLVKGVPEWSKNWEEIGKEFPIWATRNKKKITFRDNTMYYINRFKHYFVK